MENDIRNIMVTDVEKVPMKNSDFYRYKFSLDIGSEDCVNAYINCDNQYGSYVYFEKYKSQNEGAGVQIPFEKIKEDAISTVLNEVLKIDELSEWAKKVVDSHDMVADQIIKSGFAIVNEEKTIERMKEDKERIFSFYQDEDIEYLIQRPYDLLSEKEKDTLSFFSDWHKDVYGYRPRELANECQYRLAQEQIQNNNDEYEHE